MPQSTDTKPVIAITHRPGRHCGSSAIRDLLEFHGTTLTEAMCFGLGSGLGITYLMLPNAPVPFLVHVRSLGYEERVFQTLDIPFTWTSYGSIEEGAQALDDLLDQGRPALLLTDIFHLPYFASRTHFPGHAIVAWQRQAADDYILVTDTERPAPIPLARAALARARFSELPPFFHAGNLFAPSAIHARYSVERVAAAIRHNARLLLEGAPHSGVAALDTWLADLGRWEREGDWRWTTRFAYQIIERRGTGGGGFRKMYAEFLEEAALADPHIADLGLPVLMAESARCWSELAVVLKDSSESENFPVEQLSEALLLVRAAERRYCDAALTY
ncbi:MAG TPA: BtrH N-terminal domain-containing protein [Nitrospira sp.]|uniref:DUF4872 domain-containing protein n=1 Tax=Candidatus Dojkabacteria bacterium TaxID=2099670 RepID=A0A5C7JBH4_9BACT|nr:MAG: DUF4872 domain-containing protein [Candidatus Dojkabacteria bacterium]HNC83950.1 BtrH N-terminal domain-containing protein [Nitrospira sp.]